MDTLTTHFSFPYYNIIERQEMGYTVLAPAGKSATRRILYVNSYGGFRTWHEIRNGRAPRHHLWGCLELVAMGYEVALAEPLQDFYLYRNPIPHDLRLFRIIRSWLGRDGIVYCGHNVLYWIPLLRALGRIRCPIVSLLFAREPLDFCTAHSAIVALTPAAADHARRIAPRAQVKHLGWGADLNFYPTLAYDPEWFLSCGKTNRDFATLHAASVHSRRPIRIIASESPSNLSWPPNVKLIQGGFHRISFDQLLYDNYARCSASLIILQYDPDEHTAVGFTNMIEAMAMARPFIVTKTGALATELDACKTGVGLHVPPGDSDALREAIERIASDSDQARQMGQLGRRLCETHYHIERYAAGLHELFQTL